MSAASRLLAPGSLIGRSVHSVEGARRATGDGADFLVVGTMYATASHPGAEPAGPGLLRRVEEVTGAPLVGIGGINPDNVAEVMAAGASGVAVIRSVLAADDPAAASRELMAAISSAWNGRPALSQADPGRTS